MTRSLHAQPLADWRRIRRYTVPRWMIEQATERRLAGDWRGACEAAAFEVAFDLDEIARRRHAKIAERLAADLPHLVPDLVRWHFPQADGGTIAPRTVIALADYDTGLDDPEYPDLCCFPFRHRLYVETPALKGHPQRLRLGFGHPQLARGERKVEQSLWPRHLWDERHTAELLRRCGGGDRAPFFHRDGTPLAEEELPTSNPGPDDPVRHTEWVTLLQAKGRARDAYADAGVDIGFFTPEDQHGIHPEDFLSVPVAPTRLRAEIIARLDRRPLSRLLILHGTRYYRVYLDTGRSPGGDLRVRARIEPGTFESWGPPPLPEAVWRRLPDLDLLRTGLITPEELHPLVRSALFPDRPAPDGPVGPPAPEEPRPVRVRCCGEWHELRMLDGVLTDPHTEEEHERERAMSSLGGEVTGCFAAVRAWTEGHGDLPEGLREQRDEVFLRVQHSDTPGLSRLLDAGLDPRVRDTCGCTLLHRLHLVDHRKVLPRLLAVRLDLQTLNGAGQTPLEAVSGENASDELVQALLEAGAKAPPSRSPGRAKSGGELSDL
jgi:hypothetical protein